MKVVLTADELRSIMDAPIIACDISVEFALHSELQETKRLERSLKSWRDNLRLLNDLCLGIEEPKNKRHKLKLPSQRAEEEDMI